jgi:hypothetical protein
MRHQRRLANEGAVDQMGLSDAWQLVGIGFDFWRSIRRRDVGAAQRRGPAVDAQPMSEASSVASARPAVLPTMAFFMI